MSFTNLTPLSRAHLDLSQLGVDTAIIDENQVLGHSAGHSGAGTQDYTEFLAGDAAGNRTSADNTTGTKFFPDIKYWVGMYNLSLYVSGLSSGDGVELEVTANTIKQMQGLNGAEKKLGDDFSKTGADGGTGTLYDPDNATSFYFHIYPSTEINGRFNRIAIFKMVDSTASGRCLLIRGPSN